MTSMIDSLLECQKQEEKERKREKKLAKAKLLSQKSSSSLKQPKKKSKALSAYVSSPAPASPPSQPTKLKKGSKTSAWQLREAFKHEPSASKTPRRAVKAVKSISTPSSWKPPKRKGPTTAMTIPPTTTTNRTTANKKWKPKPSVEIPSAVPNKGGVTKRIKKLKDPLEKGSSSSQSSSSTRNTSSLRRSRSAGKLNSPGGPSITRSRSVGRSIRTKSTGKENLPPNEKTKAAADALKNRLANRFKEIADLRDSHKTSSPISSSDSNNNNNNNNKESVLRSNKTSYRKGPESNSYRGGTCSNASKSNSSKPCKKKRQQEQSLQNKSADTNKSSKSSSSSSSSSSSAYKKVRAPRSLAEPERLAPWQIREQQKHRVTPMALYDRRQDEDEEDSIGAKFSLPVGLTSANTNKVVPLSSSNNKSSRRNSSNSSSKKGLNKDTTSSIMARETQKDGKHIGHKDRQKTNKEARHADNGSFARKYGGTSSANRKRNEIDLPPAFRTAAQWKKRQ